MADISKTVAIIFEGQDNTGASIGKIEQSLKGVGAEADAANPKLDALATSTKKIGDNASTVDFLTESMKRLATAFVVKEFIDANVEAEKFLRAMTLLKGGTNEAATEFKYISEITNTLGINITGAAQAYVSLTAATKGTALEGQATRDIFEAVSRAMSLLGKSSADTSGALLAISQIVSKGTVSMEELRGQLGERLPGAFGIAAKSMGVTTAELDKLVSSGTLTAEVFLPKFAAALNETFGDTTQIEGFAASAARLQNALQAAFVEIGNTGLFDAITKGAQVATAAITGAVATIELIGKTWGAFAVAVQTGDFKSFGENFGAAVEAAAEKTRGARDAMLGLNDAVKITGDTTRGAGASLQNYSNEGRNSLLALRSSTAEVDAALKTLGVDPKKFKNDIGEIIAAFANLANNPDAKGDQILAGFQATLKSIKDNDSINAIGGELTAAFLAGKVSAVDFSTAVVALGKKQEELNKAFGVTTDSSKVQTDALKKQADETKRAEENAAKMALELEKLASNERIKNLEFSVNLKIADIEATTKRVEAAFSSIDNTIKVTTESTGKLFELFASSAGFLTGSQLREITDQIDKENAARDRAFDLQKRLTEAQIEALKAQTRNLEKGDALIKIDGAGLQPQLEAFMWEILKTIQVRVNSDGLAMLLGIP